MPAPMPMTPEYTLLAFSSLWISTLLAAGGGISTPELACGAAGVFGGSITQLLTLDTRKPTRKVILAEMMCSGLCGYAAFAYWANHNPTTIIFAAVAGGAGARLWHLAVDKMQKWFTGWGGPQS